MQIEVKIIADSISATTGSRVTTFECDYPRFIHAEVMTHRQFGRNAQSSRAVPVNKTLETNKEWVRPIVYGANQSGMSSTKELSGIELESAKQLWDSAAHDAFVYSKQLSQVGLHKQWANRITEPFSRIKVIITATEFDNFFWLRRDPDAAQPEIVDFADKMHSLYSNSAPVVLKKGQWHLPYVQTECLNGSQIFLDSSGEELQIEDALKISASCCAQVSYRKLDDSKEKAIEIYDKLFSGPKPHMSPTEHQAKCIDHFYITDTWPDGVTSLDRSYSFWSGNLKGFVQYRQLLAQ